MTDFNALYSFKKEGVHGIANENTNISFYGPAVNTLVAVGLLGYVSDGKQISVGFDGHRDDFVSRVIGGNGYTYETVPAGSNWWKEAWKMFTDPYNLHTCFGDAGNKRRIFFVSSHLEKKLELDHGERVKQTLKLLDAVTLLGIAGCQFNKTSGRHLSAWRS